MGNVGVKGLLVTLWQRVFKSYKTTLLGIVIVAAGYAIDWMTGNTVPWVHQVGVIVGTLFALVKEKLPAPPPVSDPQPVSAPTQPPAQG